MATPETTIRRKKQPADELALQLSLAHSAITILGMQPTPTSILTRSQRLRLADVSRRYGISSEQLIRRAVSLWVNVEAPVYLAKARA